MEDPAKVTAILNGLNKGLPSKPWVAVDGNNVLPQANRMTGGFKFDYDYGYPVKIFVNSRTGEMRIYAAKLLEY